VKFTRGITVRPAYDCTRVKPCVHGSEECSENPWRNHGVNNAELRLTMWTEDHEVSLTVNTGWYLPQTPLRSSGDSNNIGSSVVWHSRYDILDTEARTEADPKRCPRGWETCYSDMAYILADEGALLLVTEGTEAVWAWLEDLYNDRFGGTENE
jgi:hypothetical protein